MHALIENGQIVKISNLPTSWNLKDGRSVSGFNLWPTQDILTEGWFPIIEQRAALGPDQHYGNPVYTIRANDVLAMYPVENDPIEDKNQRTIYTNLSSAMNQLTTIITAAPANVSNVSQAQTAIRQLQQAVATLARNQRLLIRQVRGDFSGID